MDQITKIESRSMIGNMLFESMKNPLNQKFFPFYYFTSFKVKNDDPIFCDYCGEDLHGNGHYESAYFVWENPQTIKICCSIREHIKGEIWDYHHQIIGQRKHIQLPITSTPEMRLVFHWAFRGKSAAGYKIMNYKKIDLWNTLKEIVNTDSGGGTYGTDGADFYEWHSNKLISYNYTDSKIKTVLQLSQYEILNIVNQMLFSMKCYQLSLF